MYFVFYLTRCTCLLFAHITISVYYDDVVFVSCVWIIVKLFYNMMLLVRCYPLFKAHPKINYTRL